MSKVNKLFVCFFDKRLKHFRRFYWGYLLRVDEGRFILKNPVNTLYNGVPMKSNIGDIVLSFQDSKHDFIL